MAHIQSVKVLTIMIEVVDHLNGCPGIQLASTGTPCPPAQGEGCVSQEGSLPGDLVRDTEDGHQERSSGCHTRLPGVGSHVLGRDRVCLQHPARRPGATPGRCSCHELTPFHRMVSQTPQMQSHLSDRRPTLLRHLGDPAQAVRAARRHLHQAGAVHRQLANSISSRVRPGV